MNDQTDSQLLGAWAKTRSEPAFAELVRRHVDFVHSAAVRMVCDSHLAKDVTQSVFVALARDAARIADCRVLAGWLHRTAQNIAAQTVRTDVRRRAREQEAATMNELLAESGTGVPPVWSEIAPHLDAALGELSEPDRDAVLLRYFENKFLREVGQALGTSDDTAQKRVSRAVERLREFFAKRGVTVGASGLVVVISANAVQAAPAGLAVTISTTAALTGITIAATATATAVKTIAMTTLQKTVIGATLAVAVGAGIYEASQNLRLREQNHALQQQHAPLAGQLQQLIQALGEATNQIAVLRAENERANRIPLELLKLRGEVGVLRREATEASDAKARAAQPPLSSARGYLERGTKHFANGESEDALDDLNKAIELDPNSTEALYYRAHLLASGSKQRNPEVAKAVADFSRILELKPNAGDVRSFRAWWYGVLKQYDNAIGDYTTVINGDTDFSKFNEGKDKVLAYMHLNRGRLYYEAKKDYAKAIADYTTALKLNPEMEGVHRLRGECYQALGDTSKAQQDFVVEKAK